MSTSRKPSICERHHMARVLFDEGVNNLNSGDFELAVLKLEDAVQTSPYGGVFYYTSSIENGTIYLADHGLLDKVHSYLGDAYNYAGKYALAIQAYTRAVLLGGNLDDYYKRAKAHEKMRNMMAAISDYKRPIYIGRNFVARDEQTARMHFHFVITHCPHLVIKEKAMQELAALDMKKDIFYPSRLLTLFSPSSRSQDQIQSDDRPVAWSHGSRSI